MSLEIESVLSVCDRAFLDYAYESAGVPPPQFTGRPAPTWPFVLVNVTTAHAQPDIVPADLPLPHNPEDSA